MAARLHRCSPMVGRRQQRRRRTAAALAAIVVVLLGFITVELVLLQRRVAREVVNPRWKQPTRIFAHDEPSEPAVVLYGSLWRATEPVVLDQIPEHVPMAFVAAEDERFSIHPGVDPIALGRALLANLRAGEVVQGGSTITQQLIKAQILTSERTFRRKLLEVPLAVYAELRLSKDEILETYLNQVYLGHSGGYAITGIGEGARRYFGKEPGKLRASEAALLAAIVRAPNRDNPLKRPDVARERRDAILRIMRQKGWLTVEELDDALDDPAKFDQGVLPSRPFPWYLAALRRDLEAQLGAEVVARGGLTIVASLDPERQRAAERAIDEGLRRLERSHSWIRSEAGKQPLQAALLSIDPADGGVRAMVGGADFSLSPIDRTSSMRRQPGSAFKPFVYLAAIQAREITPSTLLLDRPLTVKLGGGRVWEPQNYDQQFRGRVTAREAFEKSLNVPAVRVAQEMGESKIVRAIRPIGFEGEMDAVPALPLGVIEVSMKELVSAYTIFPNLGVRTTPRMVYEVRSDKGDVLYRTEPQQVKVADPAASYILHSMLRGVVKRGTGSRLQRYGLGHAAGKTGTTSDYRDAWFVGYTPDLVTAAWVGFDSGTPLRLSSAEAALPIWGGYMNDFESVRGYPDPPAGVIERTIDPETGLLWREGCAGPRDEVFLEGTQPKLHCPPRFLGELFRRAMADESFEEPSVITIETFRKWSREADRTVERAEKFFDWVEGIFD
ncbi:MAG TPA: PBP1A family penicillin-binding protein [Thermoanaerobaculia bacterium]|nr:PBP1A family penicillin-binding protein [Thermoanaerobaculia bacterium]